MERLRRRSKNNVRTYVRVQRKRKKRGYIYASASECARIMQARALSFIAAATMCTRTREEKCVQSVQLAQKFSVCVCGLPNISRFSFCAPRVYRGNENVGIRALRVCD